MRDEILDDLIQRVLDGEGTPEEARRLEARLATDPQVRERHAELQQVFAGLAAIELEHAPAGLHASIMSAVRASAPNAARPQPAARAPRQPLRFARMLLPVAAGLIAGAFGWAAISGGLGPAGSASDLSGAMGAAPVSMPLLTLGGLERGVTVSASRGDKGATVLELAGGSTPVQVWVASPGNDVSLTADPAGAASDGLIAEKLAPGSVLRVVCVPLHGSPAVRVTAKLADGSVAEGVLNLEWLPWAKRGKR